MKPPPRARAEARRRVAVLRARLERLLLWRVWERMLEIESIDRSVALAGKAFVSFFPLVIVVAAFVPQRIRSAILTTITARLGIRGDALTIAMDAFASSEEIRQATGVLGLVFTIFFATSFTTALQRMYLRAPPTPSPAYAPEAPWPGSPNAPSRPATHPRLTSASPLRATAGLAGAVGHHAGEDSWCLGC